jgi:DNA polymerase-3 subunit delta
MADEPTELKPVYLLTGSDRPKIARALQRLRARVGAESTEQLSVPAASAEDVVAACNSLGMFGDDARLVIVDGVDRWKAPDVKSIAGYLADPAPGTVLALVADELKADSALGKACAKAGQVLAYAAPKRNLPNWVSEQFKLAGARAEPDACAALVHLVGDDLQALATEVDKLATWAAGEPIGEREVEQLAAAFAETPTFTLTDAWGAREPGRTLEASESIFEREGKPRRDTAPRLAGALGSHLARVRSCKRLAAEGVRPREAAGRLKMHPFYAQKVFAQAEAFSADELDGAVARLAELDLALTGGSRLAPDLELQRALVDITRGARD